MGDPQVTGVSILKWPSVTWMILATPSLGTISISVAPTNRTPWRIQLLLMVTRVQRLHPRLKGRLFGFSVHGVPDVGMPQNGGFIMDKSNESG